MQSSQLKGEIHINTKIEYEDEYQHRRGQWGEITESPLFREAEALVEKAGKASKIDEHGNWNFVCDFDRKGRGVALNWDLYGVDHDIHTGGLLAVVQIRQSVRQRAGWFLRVRKNYFLVGTNEDGTTFAHAVSANVVHAAINHNTNVVLAVQRWMFGCDYQRVIREGVVTIAQSHQLMGAQMRRTPEGDLYAQHPTLIHTKGTHPTVKGTGWFRLAESRRADFWRFAAPTID